MAEAKASTKPTPPSPPKASEAPAPPLLSAAASQDPAVHQVLAEIDVARRNGNDEAVRAGIRRLAELGYE